MRHEYRTFGPNIIFIPKDIQINVVSDQKRDEALTPIDQVISDRELDGWEFVQLIPGFNMTVGASESNLSLPQNMPQQLMLPGACVLMRKGVK